MASVLQFLTRPSQRIPCNSAGPLASAETETTPHAGAARSRIAAIFAVAVFAVSAVADNPCAAIATFEDGRAPTAEIHVAMAGSDTAGDGSAANPYRTIAFAAARATPGAAVRVHAGTYAGGGFIENLRGRADAPIWIGGAPGESRPIINGGSEGLHLVRPRYLILHDLEVTGAASNGVNCDDGGDYGDPNAARYVVFRGLDIHDIGSNGNQDGLKLSGLNDFFVLDSSFARCGGGLSGSGVDHVGCHRGLIARCEFRELSANGVQCKGGSEDLEIRWCLLVDAGERGVNIGGSTDFEFFRPPLSTTESNAEARDIRVVSNVIVGGTAAFAFVGCVDSLVANNTIVTPHNWLFRILQETTTSPPYEFLPCGNNAVINNVFYFDRSDLSTYVNIGGNTAPATFDFANNLWYAYDNPGASTPTLPAAEVDGVYGQDPAFQDAGAGDYRIGAGSPAAGAGRAPAGAPADRAGTCYRTPPSIGAYEIPCVGDLDDDGDVDLADLTTQLGQFGQFGAGLSGDLDEDGDVDLADLTLLLSRYGSTC